jgi:molybdopterin synthase catalytic subunit
MPVELFVLTERPLSVETLATMLEGEVRNRGEGCGALCTFIGIVRATNSGRTVRYLEYEGYGPLAVRAFERIAREAEAEWPDARLAIHHRVGRLNVGDASVAIVAAAAHRAHAFAASRYAIERVKQIAPVWKHEFFENGDVWIEGAQAEPDDPRARQLARDRACA